MTKIYETYEAEYGYQGGAEIIKHDENYETATYLSDEIIGSVKYNSDLDYWSGSSWENGGKGKHKGIAKRKNGTFVIIVGTDWQGQREYAYEVSNEEALEEILEAGQEDLLDEKKFSVLKELHEAQQLEKKLRGLFAN